MVPPHPSLQLSHVSPAEAQVRGTQGEHSPAAPPEGHVPSALQVPKSRTLPQPSAARPQAIPASAQLMGTHVAEPQQSQSNQTCGGTVTASQQLGERPGYTQAQEPQLIRLPQPSDAGPLMTPSSAHVMGWQADGAHALHWPGVPAAPHA